jgi:hypothetical protein
VADTAQACLRFGVSRHCNSSMIAQLVSSAWQQHSHTALPLDVLHSYSLSAVDSWGCSVCVALISGCSSEVLGSAGQQPRLLVAAELQRLHGGFLAQHVCGTLPCCCRGLFSTSNWQHHSAQHHVSVLQMVLPWRLFGAAHPSLCQWCMLCKLGRLACLLQALQWLQAKCCMRFAWEVVAAVGIMALVEALHGIIPGLA